MANEVNDNILILTETFSCTISVSAEEITIKKPSNEQQSIEQLIIQIEQQAYQETLAKYKHNATLFNFIFDIPGFEDTFQQKLEASLAGYHIVKIPEEDISLLSSVSPFTSGLNISTPIIYRTPHYSIIYARGKQKQSHIGNSFSSNAIKTDNCLNLPTDLSHTATSRTHSSVTVTNEAYYDCSTNLTGLSINDNGISFNIISAFNFWNKASIKH